MLHKRPIFIGQLGPDVSTSLGRLAGIEGLARAMLVGIVPLIALEVFGSKDVIASVYFGSTLFTLLFTLNLPILERFLKRRGLVTLSGLLLVSAVVFYGSRITSLFAVGIAVQGAGASMFSVCISLYVMNYIGKKDLTRAESKRMIYMGAAWLIGPALGGWLFDQALGNLIYLISFSAAIGMIAYFWWLRLGDDEVITTVKSPSVNPLRSIGRYWQQPNLRIAYLVTFSRACYWVALFVYGPIYVVEAGLPAWVGGVMLSGVSGLLFFSPIIRNLADRFGTRQVIISCYYLIGGSLFALGLIGESQPTGVIFWVTGAMGAVCIDILGNIPFMRMVKPRERTAMTTVFSTWRESSSLVTQAIVFVTLLIAPFWGVFLVMALMQFGAAIATSFLPRRI